MAEVEAGSAGREMAGPRVRVRRGRRAMLPVWVVVRIGDLRG